MLQMEEEKEWELRADGYLFNYRGIWEAHLD